MREIARRFSRNDVIAKQLKNTTLPEDQDKWDAFIYQEKTYWIYKELSEAVSPVASANDVEQASIRPFLEEL